MSIGTTETLFIGIGNGVTVNWSFLFTSPAVGSDIVVTYIDASGTLTPLNPSQYSLTFDAVAPGQIWPVGGSVLFPLTGPGIANGTSILIQRILPLVQPTSLTNIGAYSPTAVEGALDQLEMQIQQVATDVALAPQAPANYTGHVPELLPPFTPSTVLSYDSNGNIVAGSGAEGGGGGGGGGTVTSVGTGIGLTGGPVITSGTISVAPSTANSLAGYNGGGTFSNVTVGNGLTLSGGSLTASGAVTSISNSDGTLTVSPNSGAVVISLESLPSSQILVGNGSNIAAPVAMNGDATMTNLGAITVTKTNGTLLGTMATQNASSVNITGGAITGMNQPVNGSDVANKTYVDNSVSGTALKAACLSVNTTSLTAVYSNGSSGVGATLTNSSTLVQFSTSDGVTPSTSSRILIAGQSGATFQNGIYSVTTQGSGGVAWVLTRTTDFNTSATVSYGANTIITSGTVYAGTTWVETGSGPFTIGTTPITFIASSAAAQNVTLTGNITGTGTGSIATTIANNAVTTAMIQNNAITNALVATSSANTLAGYSSIGAFSDVSIGTGLQLSGGTLTSTAAITSVSNSDGSLTISPTTGAVVASLNVAHTNTWTASQSFNNGTANSFDVKNPTGAFFTNGSPAACMAFAHGRLFVGEAVANLGSSVGSTGSEWCEALSPDTVLISQFASVSRISGIGVLGASRTSDEGSGVPGSMGTQGLTAIVNNDNTSVMTSSYGIYGESWKQASATSTSDAQGMELTCINLGSTINTDPYNVDQNGLTETARFASGKIVGNTVATALCFANTGSNFNRGIIFQNNSIAVDSNGHECAINMAQGHLCAWWVSQGNLGPYIRSDVSSTSAGQSLPVIWGNGTFNVQDGSANNLFSVGYISTGVGSLKLSGVTLFQGASVYMNAAQSIPNNTRTVVSFGTAQYDDNSFWNSATRLTVPAGVTRVVVAAGSIWDSITSGQAQLTIQKNGVTLTTDSYAGQPIGTFTSQASGGTTDVNISSGVLSVTAGDYFEVSALQTSGGSINIAPTNAKNQKLTWFSIQVIK